MAEASTLMNSCCPCCCTIPNRHGHTSKFHVAKEVAALTSLVLIWVIVDLQHLQCNSQSCNTHMVGANVVQSRFATLTM